jgi:hypothetical protein
MAISADAFTPTTEDGTVANEVWRSRAALARHAAAELREQMRTGLWMARRNTAYTRWLLDEARSRLDLSPPERDAPAPFAPAGPAALAAAG